MLPTPEAPEPTSASPAETTAAADTVVAHTNAANTDAPEPTGEETPATETPATETPATEAPAAETPAAGLKAGGGRQIVVTDPKAIKALTHRARVLVIDELIGSRATRTATELAELTGLTPSAMSYHLRELERFGLVERVSPPKGANSDGRERHWRAMGDSVVTASRGGQYSQLTNYAQTRLDTYREKLVAEIEFREKNRRHDSEIPASAYMYFGSLFLDEENEKEFLRRINELEKEFTARSREADDPAVPRRRTYYLLSGLPDRTQPFPGEDGF